MWVNHSSFWMLCFGCPGGWWWWCIKFNTQWPKTVLKSRRKNKWGMKDRKRRIPLTAGETWKIPGGSEPSENRSIQNRWIQWSRKVWRHRQPQHTAAAPDCSIRLTVNMFRYEQDGKCCQRIWDQQKVGSVTLVQSSVGQNPNNDFPAGRTKAITVLQMAS